MLKNVRHEKFAQAMAKGLTLEAAHREAGYSAHRGTAVKLAKSAHISARIEQLREKAEEKLEYRREDFVRDLRDRFRSLDKKHPVTAKYGEMLAKAQGWNEAEKVELSGGLDVVIRIGGAHS
jgi:phage terminase small subunit